MSTPNTYLILTAGRSGSTSLAGILDTASNGVCQVEPKPRPYLESRRAFGGDRLELVPRLKAMMGPRIADVHAKDLVYGDKNLQYAPMVPELYAAFGCKFVYLYRDGRDVVASLMNWHRDLWGNIYRESKDPEVLTRDAFKNASGNPADDLYDYARPRPLPGDPLYEQWDDLSRFEKLAWYWAEMNRHIQAGLQNVPDEAVISIDYSNITADRLKQLFDFLGLQGFNQSGVQKMLDGKINSMSQRTGARGRFPYWADWDADLRQKFARFAGPTMTKLGYWTDEDQQGWEKPKVAPKPSKFINQQAYHYQDVCRHIDVGEAEFPGGMPAVFERSRSTLKIYQDKKIKLQEPFARFEQLCAAVASATHVCTAGLLDVDEVAKNNPSKVVLNFRHDIDHDIFRR